MSSITHRLSTVAVMMAEGRLARVKSGLGLECFFFQVHSVQAGAMQSVHKTAGPWAELRKSIKLSLPQIK